MHTSVATYHEDLLRQRGYETIYLFTRFTNEVVLKPGIKMGVKVVGRVRGVRILGWRFSRYHLERLE